ncbi:MAG: restriction endonuclease subunit S, partial [SAR202 cluster bacterium]|nr:restriction endonuclease subunit S [SAR202 cluster bacterium]
DIANLNFPLLCLEIQQRIVAKVVAAFAEINKLLEASEINIKNINKYIGRVTDYLIHNDIKNYKNFTLNDITNNITCGVAKRPEYVDKGIIFLSARNVKHGKMKWVNYKFISEEAHKILTKNSKPEVGDILYSRVGAGFGDAAIIDRDVELSIFVSLTLIKVKPIVLNEYIFYYLNSPIIKELARKNITGTGVGNLNVGAVKRFKIKLPDLKNQKLIIDKLKSLNILGENIINNYIKKKNNYIALKQSIYDSLLFNKKTKVA